MHEYSIVDSIVNNVLDIAKSNNACGIEKIFLSVGMRSNIDKSLLYSAFENFKLEFNELKNCDIDIKIQEIILLCNDCDFKFHSLDNPICPKCFSKNTVIVDGRDIRLDRVSLFINE